jgi:hypothetical protein
MALLVMLGVVVVASATAWLAGFMFSTRAVDLAEELHDRFLHLIGRSPVPAGRPIEDVAADVRRCGIRFYALHPHASFAKVQAVRMAYDRSLGECCQVFGVPHLLDVLEPGRDLDVERDRVEDALTASGVSLPRAA